MVSAVEWFSIVMGLFATAAFNLIMFSIYYGVMIGFWTGAVSLAAGMVGKKEQEAL